MRKVFTILSLLSSSFLAGAQTSLVPDNYNPLTYEIPVGQVEGTHYLPNKIIFKLKEGAEDALNSPNFSPYLQSIGAHAELMFPQAEKPIRKTDGYGRKLADLTRIYEVSYTSSIPVKDVMALLKKSGLMEYVQPKIIVQKFSEEEKINFVPNDPDLSSQWHINKINAPQAWDVSTGNPTVIVGIPDGGTNLSHPDLLNIAYNTADPIDGIDNDSDGWIDNYQGWNTGSSNNNPQYNVGGGLNHGVASTGTASATVNNGINGAGISYNSPYLPIKIADASNNFSGAEQGVFYAAQKGAKIINCSWGGTSPWPLLEDVTRYAVFNKGCFVVSSAGNSNNSAPYWPGAYPWVTCVAGSNSSDLKSSTSSYYDFVDITAPGEAIFTTSLSAFENVGTGTSWSAPMVSGSAALVLSHFPSYTPEQVDALLKETSFNLYSLPGNALFTDKLGRGRLDIGAALTVTPGPSIKMITRDWTDGNDNLFSPGENVSLSGNFINWLNPSSASLRCTLTTSNPNVTIIDSIVTIGILNNLATFNNLAVPFTIHIGASCPVNTNILFKLKFNDGAYVDKQFFSLVVNNNFLNVTQNNVFTSVSSNGRIGFMDENNTAGLGLSKNGMLQHLVASSFMLANSATRVSDATVSTAVIPFTNDFVSVIPATKLATPIISDFDAYGSFNDNNAGANKLDVRTNYKVWAWDDPGFENFVIIEYTLINTGAATLSNLYSGIFSYWEIPNGQFYLNQFMANWDGARKLGYASSSPNPVGSYAGVKLLSYDAASWYAFNNDGAGGSIQWTNGFTEAEKYTAISNGVSRPSTVPGSGISGLLGTGPFNIPMGDSVKVAFALLLGDNLTALETSAEAAQTKYDMLNRNWTGAVSTDWNDPLNWFPNMAPNACNTDINIPLVANQPSITGTDITVGNIKIADGAIITIQNDQRLKVCKNINGGNTSGSIISGGRLELMGTSKQYISGKITSTFVLLNNVSGTEIQPASMLSINTGIELQAGNLTTNGNLTLLSNATHTAYINNFDAGFAGNVVGNIHAQRHISLGVSGYRQLGTPVLLPSIASLSGFTPSGTPGFVIPLPACDPNVVDPSSPSGNWMQFVENGTAQFNCAQSLFQVLTSGGMTNARGYYMNVSGDDILTFTGLPNNGSMNLGLTHTNATITDGWNMVSNPYPSPLQWEIGNIPVGVNAIAKVLQTSGPYSGTYMDLDPHLDGTQTIDIGQAFQVQVSGTATAAMFTVDNSDRTTIPSSYPYADSNPMTLQIDIQSGGFADLTKIRFMGNAASGSFDDQFDSHKMDGKPNQPAVYNSWFGENYSTNSLGDFDDVYTIPLGLKLTQTGSHTLVFSHLNTFPASSFIFLEDTETNTLQNMRVNDTYSFNANSGVDESRFLVRFYPPIDISVTQVTCDTKGTVEVMETAPVDWDFSFTDLQTSSTLQGTFTHAFSFTNLDAGNYILDLTEQSSGYQILDTINITGVTQVNAQPSASQLSVEVDTQIQFMANAPTATTYLWNFGDLDTSPIANPQHTYSSAGTYLVTLVASNNTCQDTAQLSVNVSNHSSIKDLFDTHGVKLWNIYDDVYLQFAQPWEGKTTFTLYDAAGKNVFQKHLYDAQGSVIIHCGTLASGIYTAELRGKNIKISRKMWKGIE